MKTKIHKIFGVALALVLVFSLAGAFLPVNVAAWNGAPPTGPVYHNPGTTPNQWQGVTIPSSAVEKLRAANVADIAVASDGRTIYAVDTQFHANTGQGFAILQTDTSGWRWTNKLNAAQMAPATPGALFGPPRLVAVAPDDPKCVAIVDSTVAGVGTAGGLVWISNNGGITWAALVAVPGNVGATSQVMDVVIGPARAGTILGRDYAVAVADTATGAQAGGDIFFTGLTTAWTSVAVNDASLIIVPNLYDFTSLAMSPGYLGDRCIAAVGHDDTPATAGTYLILIRLADVAPLATVINPPGALLLEVTATIGTSPQEYDTGGAVFGAPIAGVLASDVELPADFDPTIPNGMRTFVSWASFGGPAVSSDDVYRADFQTVRKLQTATATGIWSIAYSGTISGGILIAGDAGPTVPIITLVHHTEDPNVSQPSWQTSAKSPTGTSNCVVGIDPADPTLVYAGTTGVESAFSASTNGAVSFNQRAMVNTEADILEDVAVTPDGAMVFLATADNGLIDGPCSMPPPYNQTGSGSVLESLWRSKIPTSAETWERVRISPLDWAAAPPADVPGDSIIRLNPEWDDAPTLYWCDSYGATMGIERSVDGGEIFGTRVAPRPIADIAVENADTLYLGDAGSNNIYKSTNGAWFFGLPVSTSVAGNVFDLEMAPSYPATPVPGNVLVGGTVAGSVSRTWTGGGFFVPLTPWVAGGTNMQVIADVDFANNKTIYCGSLTAGQGIWRFEIGTSTVWENIRGLLAAPFAGTETITGLATSTGVLYGSWAGGAVLPALGTSGAERSLIPDVPVIASWIYDIMNVGSGAAVFNVAPNALKVSSDGSTVALWAINTVRPLNPVPPFPPTRPGTLMAYHDTMALFKADVNVPAEVPIDSVSGRNQQFSISWNQTSNETDYEVEIFTDPAGSNLILTSPFYALGPAWYVAINPLAPSWVVGQGLLVAGQEYFVRLRVRDQIPNDAIRSPYTSMHRFEVQGGERVEVSYLGVQPLGPVPGATGVPLSPGFTWSPYASSTRYEFQLATDAGFTDIIAEAKVSATGYKYDGTLDYATTYFWRARGIEPTATDWSPVSSFTTEKKEVPAPPPVVIEPPPPAPPPVVSPLIIWVIVAIGAILVIAVIVLIVRTRRVT